MAPAKKYFIPIKDVTKITLLLAKVLLEGNALWPELSKKATKILNWMMIGLWTIIVTGQIVFVAKKANDLSTIASVMSEISIGFQFIIKALVLTFYASKLTKLLKKIWIEFWPCTLAEQDLYKGLKFRSSALIISMSCMFLSAYIFSMGFVSFPLIKGLRVLPLQSVYPFDWTSSPTYEIICVVQWFAHMYILVASILGHDFLFYGICANIIAQFLLLQQMINRLGTSFVQKTILELDENSEEVSRRFDVWRNEGLIENDCDDFMLLKRCVRQHQILLRVCRDTKEIFAISSFLQLIASVCALCMGCVLITDKSKTDNFVLIQFVSYVLGHLIQLFLACAAGNEVMYQAEALTTYIFSSSWYNIENIKTKKEIIFLLQRLQKPVTVSALGIADMNYATFINVLKTSFSFYTMLLKVTEIKK